MMRALLVSRVNIVLSAMFLAGCVTTGPKYANSTIALPPEYRNAPEHEHSELKHEIFSGSWWTHYGSAELNGLIAQGLENNSDLRIAKLQLDQAKIRADQTRSGGMPTLTAPLSVATQGSGGTTSTQKSTQISLQGSYRWDLWGEQSALTESADFQVLRAAYERDNVQRNMIGSLVTSYIAYLAVSDSLALARENEQVAKDILQTVEKRLAMGDATSDELEQQRGALASQQSVIPSLESQQDNVKTNISRLIGVLPGSLTFVVSGTDSLVVPSIEMGLPSSLLFMRPDIRVVEARMLAANANIEVARARLLPPVDLVLQSGYSGLTLAQLLQPQSFFWSSVASLAVIIFDGGRREGDKAFAKAYYEEMVETYRQVIYQAIREVESAVSSLKSARVRLEAQKRSSRSALNMFENSSKAYSIGAVDSTNLLESRRNYQRSLNEYQRAKSDELRAFADLALATGTGFSSEKQETTVQSNHSELADKSLRPAK